jgi:hypothetical protein
MWKRAAQKRLIDLAYEQAEAAGIVQRECQMKPDPIRPFPSLERHGNRKAIRPMPPHEYERGGTAKLLTLFRPATGALRAKGVLSAPNAVLHRLYQRATDREVLAEIEKKLPRETLPPESQRPLYAQWETWLGHPSRNPSLPPLRIVLVLDNLAGHLSYESFGLVF